LDVADERDEVLVILICSISFEGKNESTFLNLIAKVVHAKICFGELADSPDPNPDTRTFFEISSKID
jgi:hypothetical protein